MKVAQVELVVGEDHGIFGSMSLPGCHDVCPKNPPLQTQIAYLRRAMMKQGFVKASASDTKGIRIVKAPAAPVAAAISPPRQRQEA